MDEILLEMKLKFYEIVRANCPRFEMLMILLFFEWTIEFENIIFQVVDIETSSSLFKF